LCSRPLVLTAPPPRVGLPALLGRCLLRIALDVLEKLVDAALVNAAGTAAGLGATNGVGVLADCGCGSSRAERVPAGELDAADAASGNVVELLLLADSALGKLLQPALSLLGVAVLGTEHILEDVVRLAHAVDGTAHVLVEGKRLSSLEEQGSGVDRVLARDLLADLERSLEPDARLVVLLHCLQHDSSVVESGDRIGVVSTVDDLPQLERVADVDESALGVTRGVLEETKVQVGKNSVSMVNTECALGDDNSFVSQLKR
jgi:hypothetical protein